MNSVPDRPHRPLPFRIYVVTDRHALADGLTLPEAIERLLVAAPAGRVAVQLRDKDLPGRERAQLAGHLRLITQRHGALLFINSDIDLARSCGADGVHLPDGITLSKISRGGDRVVGFFSRRAES